MPREVLADNGDDARQIVRKTHSMNTLGADSGVNHVPLPVAPGWCSQCALLTWTRVPSHFGKGFLNYTALFSCFILSFSVWWGGIDQCSNWISFDYLLQSLFFSMIIFAFLFSFLFYFVCFSSFYPPSSTLFSVYSLVC